eukprot:jgi/Botrbrau1/23570/Bobra.0141s0035.1
MRACGDGGGWSEGGREEQRPVAERGERSWALPSWGNYAKQLRQLGLGGWEPASAMAVENEPAGLASSRYLATSRGRPPPEGDSGEGPAAGGQLHGPHALHIPRACFQPGGGAFRLKKSASRCFAEAEIRANVCSRSASCARCFLRLCAWLRAPQHGGLGLR